MALDAFKFQAGSHKWNNYSAYAAGLAGALFAVQSGWLPNNLEFGFAENSYIFLMLIAIHCKLEAGIIQRNLLINIELDKDR